VSEKKEYFEKAASWAVDTQANAARSTRFAWTAAGITAGIACFEAVALAMLVPLKTVEPITLLVDRQTGYVQALDPSSPRRVAADEALTQAFLAQYIMSREGFDRATISADYRKVALWSSASARSAYLAMMPASNPESPFSRYPAGSVVAVRVKSVSKLSDGVALVRFDTLLQDMSGRRDVAQPWISTVRYRYVDVPMSLEDRLINPLGFKVLSYRRDAEAITAEAAQSGQNNLLQSAAAPAPPADVPESQGSSPTIVLKDGRAVPLSHLPMGSPVGTAARGTAR
jgi:type IV secretion system protein VirB8